MIVADRAFKRRAEIVGKVAAAYILRDVAEFASSQQPEHPT
jgi:hypothetical protein